MNELLITLGSLIGALGNTQSATTLRDHIALVNTQLQLLKEHVENLEQENARLVERCAELDQQLIRQQSSTEFVEKRGALFKRNAGGAYSEIPCCPVCQKSMWCFQDAFPYECSDKSCGHISDLKGGELNSVIASL